MNRHSVPGARAEGAKRERILEAAIRIFAEKGFYNAKVSEIARVAGVADGTIYLYFKSKDDLLLSIFEDRMEQVNQRMRAAVEEGGSPVENLRRVVRLYLELVEQNPHLAEVLTVELRQSSKFLKEYRHGRFGDFLKLLARPIEDGQRDGQLRGDLDPSVAARALFGALDELALAWVLRPAPGGPQKKGRFDDLSHVGDQLADLFIEGLRAPGEPAPVPPQSPNARRAS